MTDIIQSANERFNKTKQCWGIKEASTHFKEVQTVESVLWPLQLPLTSWEDMWEARNFLQYRKNKSA